MVPQDRQPVTAALSFTLSCKCFSVFISFLYFVFLLFQVMNHGWSVCNTSSLHTAIYKTFKNFSWSAKTVGSVPGMTSLRGESGDPTGKCGGGKEAAELE